MKDVDMIQLNNLSKLVPTAARKDLFVFAGLLEDTQTNVITKEEFEAMAKELIEKISVHLYD